MHATSRRTFGKRTLGSLATFSLLETLCDCDCLADEIKPVTVRWLNEVNQLSQDVKDQDLKQVEWQKKVEELFAQIELSQLLEFVDFERLTKGLALKDHGAKSLRFSFRQIDGVPTGLVFGKQIFALKKGRSVVPHGHNNMATAFLMLGGTCHGRHYDRLEDEPEHFIIKPTIDRGFSPGECSSVSDVRDNVHWFKATSEKAFIFNIHILNVRPGSGLPTGRVYLDPDGEKLADGLIRARRIGGREAHELYG